MYRMVKRIWFQSMGFNMTKRDWIAILFLTLCQTKGFAKLPEFKVFPLITKMTAQDGKIIKSDLTPLAILIVGDDEASYQFIRAHQLEIKQSQPTAFMVSGNSEEAYDKLASQLPSRQLYVATGDEFAALFGVHSYPLLILPKEAL